MKPDAIEVTVGNIPLKVGLVIDEKTTRKVAQKVNARLEEIESQSARIDTREFALMAAVSFAAEFEQANRAFAQQLERIKADTAQETRDILVALDALLEALRAVLGRLGRDPEPE